MPILRKIFKQRDIIIQSAFILMWLPLETLYSVFRINISSFFISSFRSFCFQALITIIFIIIIKNREIGGTKYKVNLRKKIFLISCIIFIIAMLIITLFDFNKPLLIYWKSITGDYAPLEIVAKPGSSIINVRTTGKTVCLDTKGNLTNTIYWLKFSEGDHDWREFKEIYFYIKYDKATKFSNSAMLKAHLNNVVIIPKKGKTIILGTQNEIFLKQSRGNFYYPINPKYLNDDNIVQVTLNNGKLESFCLDIALIK